MHWRKHIIQWYSHRKWCESFSHALVTHPRDTYIIWVHLLHIMGKWTQLSISNFRRRSLQKTQSELWDHSSDASVRNFETSWIFKVLNLFINICYELYIQSLFGCQFVWEIKNTNNDLKLAYEIITVNLAMIVGMPGHYKHYKLSYYHY